jgi:hypothetical protein
MSGTPFDPDESIPADGQPSPAALAATEEPVVLSVGLLQDDRIPDGMVCMGTYRNGRLVARCAMPPEAWAQLQEYGLFDDPVPVVLVAREAPPGLQCQLFAMVTLPDDFPLEDDEKEPWADSVPSSSYEDIIADEDDEDDEDPRVAPIPLGNVVRFAKDRVHPDSLPLEAVDILQKIIEGKTSEVIDKTLEDLLGG